MLSEDRKATLAAVTKDSTVKGGLLYIAAGLLAQENLQPLDECVVKLCLTGVVNMVNPLIKAYYADVLPNLESQARRRSLAPLDADLQRKLDDLLSIGEDVDLILSYIYTQKAELAAAKQRCSDAYVMFSCLEHL